MAVSGISQTSHEHQLDLRTKQLWARLDAHGKGELDLRGLQRGLEKIDHPMKNADSMLKQMIQEADTNRDGKIQFAEFESFVRQAEAQLWNLFQQIDSDKDGRVDKRQMQHAFKRAGIAVPDAQLTDFFSHVDSDGDGFICYREWRDYLIFMPPTDEPATSLHDVLSFWSSIVTLNSEGDSLVSDETLHHTSKSGSLLHLLFGSIVRIAAPTDADKVQQSRELDVSDPVKRSISEPPEAQKSTDGRSNINASTSTKTSQMPRLTGKYASSTQSASSGSVMVATTQAGASSAVKHHKMHDEHESTEHIIKISDLVPDPGYFLAGAIAGGVSRTATAPLDRLKVYLLVNTSVMTGEESVMGALKAGRPLKAISNSTITIRRAMCEIWSQNGMRSFFAGNGLNVLKIMPETAIKFGTYEAGKRAMAKIEGHNNTNSISFWSKFAAGGFAGMVAQFCVYPLDTLKFRLQCETVKGGLSGNALLMATAKRMYQTGGVRSAYRGITMGLIGMFPYSAIDMNTFELLKKAYKNYVAQRQGIPAADVEPGNIVTGMIGASSGAFGATVVYPLNVLRTRLQTQGTHMHKATYTGIWDVATKTVTNEGVRGLYKGLTPNLLKVAPALSITWVVYENSKRLLRLE